MSTGAFIDSRDTAAAPLPKLPSEDPFYTPTTGFQQKAPGDIIKHRKVPNALGTSLPQVDTNIADTYQILFRTSDAFGKPAAAVTTLFVPSAKANPDPSKIMSYLIPADSPNTNCCPSFSFSIGSSSFIPSNQASTLLLLVISSLNKGWYVNSPDHEGLLGAQSVIDIQGKTTLDSIRAVLSSTPFTGVSKQAHAVTWGYSGGAAAGAAAAELHGSYAPELNLVGSAFGGVGLGAHKTKEDIAILKYISGIAGVTAKFASTMLGQAAAYPNMSRYLNENLLPSKADTFRTPLRMCDPTAAFKGKTLKSFFKNPGSCRTAPVPLSLITYASALGVHGVPKAPVYINNAVGDELVPIGKVDALVDNYCDGGANVQYVRDQKNNHVQEGIAGAALELRWLMARLNGEPLKQTECTRTDVALDGLYPQARDLFGSKIFDALVKNYQSFKA